MAGQVKRFSTKKKCLWPNSASHTIPFVVSIDQYIIKYLHRKGKVTKRAWTTTPEKKWQWELEKVHIREVVECLILNNLGPVVSKAFSLNGE